MAGDPTGVALFPLIQSIRSCSFTLSHGITPSRGILELAPQDNFTAAIGPLTFVFGATTITFPDCKLNRHTVRQSAGGPRTWLLELEDRRWRWRYNTISGSYNQRLFDGSVDPVTARTPQQLAVLCLLAMGESLATINVGDLPNGTFPMVNWANENPAKALADLCEPLGCRVVLQLDNTVALRRVGVGQQLPTDGVMLNSLGIKPTVWPNKITVVGGKVRFQYDFQLEAIGIDVDHSIKPIGQLSYMPKKGWSQIFPDVTGFDDVPEKNNARFYAEQTVYRLYRIKFANSDGTVPFAIPGIFPITDLKHQLVPIETQQVQMVQDPDGTQRPLPAWVFGTFADGGSDGLNSKLNERYLKPFQILPSKGFVLFNDYVYKYANPQLVVPALNIVNQIVGRVLPDIVKMPPIAPPDLWLRTAFSLRDPQTYAWKCFERSRNYPQAIGNAGTQIIHRPDLIQFGICKFNANHQYIGAENNTKQVNAEADYYLGAEELKYSIPNPQEITYAGLRPINPDGAIQQVVFSVGLTGTTTKACRNDEFDLFFPSYDERRAFEKQRGDPLRDIVFRHWHQEIEKRQLDGVGALFAL